MEHSHSKEKIKLNWSLFVKFICIMPQSLVGKRLFSVGLVGEEAEGIGSAFVHELT